MDYINLPFNKTGKNLSVFISAIAYPPKTPENCIQISGLYRLTYDTKLSYIIETSIPASLLPLEVPRDRSSSLINFYLKNSHLFFFKFFEVLSSSGKKQRKQQTSKNLTYNLPQETQCICFLNYNLLRNVTFANIFAYKGIDGPLLPKLG